MHGAVVTQCPQVVKVCLDGHTVISCTKALPPAPLEEGWSFCTEMHSLR